MTTEIERKKEKKLDRSHWMCRIQKFAFNIDAPTFYMGYCPFFWMTWLALIVAPFVALFNFITIPSMWLWRSTTEPVKTYRTTSRARLEATPLQPSFEQMVYLKHNTPDTLGAYSIWNPRSNFLDSMTDCHRIAAWFVLNPNWKKEWLPQALEWETKRAEAAKAVDQAKRARVARLRTVNRLASTCGSAIFKVLIPVVIVALALTGIYGLYSLAITVSLASYIFAGTVLLFSAAAVILARILWDAFNTILDVRSKNKTVVEDEFPSLTWWDKFTMKFSAVTDFIRDTVAITYKQECPLIIWGEETGPIEKRVK